MEDKNGKEKNETNQTYRGNNIPVPLIISWVILISWGVYYSLKYAIPDLLQWLSK